MDNTFERGKYASILAHLVLSVKKIPVTGDFSVLGRTIELLP